MSACEKCVFFRRVRPRSQLLAAVIDMTEAAAATALGKIVEDEQKQRDSEAEFKRAQASTEQDRWPRQPVMSSYCGLRQSDDVYLIAEVKNAGGGCRDFKEGRPARQACADCRHRVAAAGPARDHQREVLITQLHTEASSAQASTSSPEGLMKAHREGVPARKAFELSGAYAADGWLTAKPEYLDYCGKFSADGEYAVCALRNSHNTCTAWQAGPADEPAVRIRDDRSRLPGAQAPRSAKDRLGQIREEQERQVLELEETDPILAAAVRAHNQVTYATLVAKLSELDNKAQEAVINNLR